jgi:hypothetical protein
MIRAVWWLAPTVLRINITYVYCLPTQMRSGAVFEEEKMAEEAGKATETTAAAPAASEPGSVPVAKEEKAAAPSVFDQAWQPFLSLRREMDQLFDDFLSRTMTPFGWGRELDPFR